MLFKDRIGNDARNGRIISRNKPYDVGECGANEIKSVRASEREGKRSKSRIYYTHTI